jgi:hypothetical protein
MDDYKPMTAESVGALLQEAGAQVMVRSGRTENYSAPREFSFEVRATFPNGMGLHGGCVAAAGRSVLAAAQGFRVFSGDRRGVRPG